MTDRREVASFPNAVRRLLSDGEGGEYEHFLCVIPSDRASTLTFVPVFEESKNAVLDEVVGDVNADGYQRPGSRVRMGHFAKYLETNPLDLVPAVVLSARNNWDFEPSSLDGPTGTLRCFGPAAIIDGQHRVGGYALLYERDEVVRPIEAVVVPGLSLQAETDLFLKINNNQKSVVSGLTALLGRSDDVIVGRALNEDEDSPLKDRFIIVRKRLGNLWNLKSVEKNVARTFSHGAFEDINLDAKVEILKEYWTRIIDAFPEEWEDADKRPREMYYKLCELTGLITFSLAAADILAPNFEVLTGVMNWPKVEDELRRLSDDPRFDLRKDGPFELATGEVGGPRIHRRIQNVLAEQVRGDDLHGEDQSDE